MSSSSPNSLKEKHCVPCTGNTSAMTFEQVQPYLQELPGWKLIEEANFKIAKQFLFPDFKNALLFVNLVGNLAETEGHHPDIHLAWGKVVVEIWTHKIKGLSQSDLILAAKIDDLKFE